MSDLLLLDTHLLLWLAQGSDRLPPSVERVLATEGRPVLFSAASIWEVAIKTALRRPQFVVDPARLAGLLLAAGYRELPVTARHAARVERLPDLHGDPFDRLLVAQSQVEGCVLLTHDRQLARYGDPVRLV